jgi:hypothetical protein
MKTTIIKDQYHDENNVQVLDIVDLASNKI